MFIISKEMYQTIGKFDEIFYPAYYEDSDYIYRMNLAGIRQIIDSSLNPVEYRISSTYEKAPDLVNEAMQTNRERYIKKWGGLPLLETYTMPYDTKF
jgi:GT2 family glycosyltransferase